jgi:hypothetical protein
MNREQAIEDLIAKEQIRQAMARYSRGIDRLDEAIVKTVYHDASHDDHGFGMTGAGWDLAALCRRDGTGFPEEWKATTHFLGSHLIEVDGDDAASEVYFLSWSIFDDPDGVEWALVCSGRYVDRWERRDGEFAVAARTVIYDWFNTEKRSTTWPGPDHDVAKPFHGAAPSDLGETFRGSAGPGDPSYELLRLRSATKS